MFHRDRDKTESLDSASSNAPPDRSEDSDSPKEKVASSSYDGNSSSEEGQDVIPEPKYDVFQSVMARDQDGLIYEATIRRRMYGYEQKLIRADVNSRRI